MNYTKRIKNLERKYSETNVAKGEILSADTRKQINKNYYDNQQKRRVDAILNNVKNKDSIKEEVHDIVKETKLKQLCKNCKEEQIIAVIILYCLKTRNPRFNPEQNPLWKKYALNWKKYSLIIGRLLQETRKKGFIKPKEVDLNWDITQ